MVSLFITPTNQVVAVAATMSQLRRPSLAMTEVKALRPQRRTEFATGPARRTWKNEIGTRQQERLAVSFRFNFVFIPAVLSANIIMEWSPQTLEGKEF